MAMQEVIQPLTPAHCECLDNVIRSAPITADLLKKCAYCFESNPALLDHVNDLVKQNESQLQIASRLRSTMPAATQEYNDYAAAR